MRIEHTYELSSLAKSLKKQLGLTNFTNSQILEALAKAANAPSYGHMRTNAKQASPAQAKPVELTSGGVPVSVLNSSSLVHASAWSDDKAVYVSSFDARPFLMLEKPSVVLNAVLSQLFHGGRTEQTDEIANSNFSDTGDLFRYLAIVQESSRPQEPIGFEAEIDAVAALKFLKRHRPSVLVGNELDIADYALGEITIKGALFESWSQVFGDDSDGFFNRRNLAAANVLFDALIEYGRNN